MFDLEYLVDSLREDKHISYFRAKRIVKKIALEEMCRMGCYQYNLFLDFIYYKGSNANLLGESIDIKNSNAYIRINTLLIDALNPGGYEEFDRTDLFVILFHELEHVRQTKMFESNECDSEDFYKDRALKKHFEKNRKSPYYSENYRVITEEVLANIAGVQKTIEFFKKHNIELKEEELSKLNLKLNENLKLLNNKQRINPLDSKKYELDELYNMILSNEVGRKR